MSLFKKLLAVASTVAMVATGLATAPAALAAAHGAGSVVKAPNSPAVFFITNDGHRRGFTSPGAFLSYGFLSFSQVVDANAEDMALPEGPLVAPRDGIVFCATANDGTDVAGECSLITMGMKAAFTSADVFHAQGFDFANSRYGSSAFLQKTSNVSNGGACHLAGTLINNGGTVQLVVANGLWGIPSADVFIGWGYSWKDVVPANSCDTTTKSQVGVMASRQAGQLIPTTLANPGPGPVVGSCNLSGGAGDVALTDTSTDVETEVKEGGNNVKVLGFKVEALDSDIAVKSVKVSFENNDGGGSSLRLSRYADTVSIYEGSTKVGSADVADFTKDGDVYSKSISLDCAKVSEGTSNKKTFYVTVSAMDNIDSTDVATNDWNVAVDNVRFEDAQGAILTASDTVTDQDFAFVDLASSSDVSVTVSRGSSTPDESNVEVSDSSTTKNVLLNEFKVRTEGSSMTFDQVDFDVTATGDAVADIVSEFQLRQGSTVLATADPADMVGSTVTFDLDEDFTVDADSTETLAVYATVNDVDNYTEGDTLTADFQDFHGSLVDENGDTFADVDVDGSATGSAQTLISEGAAIQFVSDSFTAEDQTDLVDGTISLTFKVTAIGSNDVNIAEDQGNEAAGAGDGLIDYSVDGAVGNDATVTCTGAATVGGEWIVSSGETRTCTLSVKFSGTSGFVRLNILNVDQTPVSNIKTRSF